MCTIYQQTNHSNIIKVCVYTLSLTCKPYNSNMATDTQDQNVVLIEDDDEMASENANEESNNQPNQNSKNNVGTQMAKRPPNQNKGPKNKKFFQNDRYNNAYGDYSGGYGPPGFGYGRNFTRPQFGPPPPLFPSGPGPQGPPHFMWGRGFGPQGPPMRRQPTDDRTVKYLARCGVGKEHLKNLPRDLLQLMEPEYCGICAQSFDSFATSRIHYISKNHLKTQKKWLNRQPDVGFRRGKEIALKARELYCELCDVHITSKSHSDSHYAGKPHRAIVEGRKNPKNPFLLQRGMADRVSQLIRREKKHLKAEGEVEEDENKKEKEMKNIQPELYCDICKTSVTCTEQMTMHLNGKRHLSKEKQHILKMMKGETDEANDESQEKDDEEEMEGEGEEEEEKAEGENEAFVDDDWGNGSGTWEDAPTKNDDA
ncbi:zinc finger matrin-type protein 3 isoform X2 [Bicyclus anynana]|uniref:Zinc finger matrin-type protein 3 isoform X2 n=1 Tax=Bicyclus anynana TaxID=110368 RepID=A0ABM3M801_BICAN|nr:zinc finger matrin-type protein 3 isoform X2 [Bicyclus anynana]